VKIAIVEDSDHIRKNLIKFISAIKDAEVVGEAEDVDPAIILIEEKKPDIVVLDIELKNSNGFNLLYKIKNFPQKSPVVMMFSNLSSVSYKEKALKAKADYFFDKTNDFDELVMTIESLIKTKKGKN